MPKRYTSYHLGGKKEHCIGFCWLHHRGLTKKQVDIRKCLKKQCGAFEKRDHPYWEQKQRTKEMKKTSKEALNETAAKPKHTENAT